MKEGKLWSLWWIRKASSIVSSCHYPFFSETSWELRSACPGPQQDRININIFLLAADSCIWRGSGKSIWDVPKHGLSWLMYSQWPNCFYQWHHTKKSSNWQFHLRMGRYKWSLKHFYIQKSFKMLQWRTNKLFSPYLIWEIALRLSNFATMIYEVDKEEQFVSK